MFAEKIDSLVEQAKQLDHAARMLLLKRIQEIDQETFDDDAAMYDEDEAVQLLTGDAWREAFNSMMISVPVNYDFSNRREDWYDDDGR